MVARKSSKLLLVLMTTLRFARKMRELNLLIESILGGLANNHISCVGALIYNVITYQEMLSTWYL